MKVIGIDEVNIEECVKDAQQQGVVLTRRGKPVALAMILAYRIVPLGQLDMTDYGERADYRSLSASTVLEISGTETIRELGRRHRDKVAQALANPFGWDACVVVCAFSSRGHRIRFSGHRLEEPAHGESEG